ncbi:MAG: DivIVA domain-containing protein [Clostridium perfringens]|nr:DivIVA domain-containing protein [Clostridium perfringens]
MRLMAREITNKEFKKVVRGYDIEAVDEHLREVEDSYQGLFRENQDLTKRVEILNEKLEHYVKIEDTIQSALILAQDTAKQVKISAEKEAEYIVKNANDSAQRILDKAQEDIIKLKYEYDKVKQEFNVFRAKYRGFMNIQMESFNDLEKDFYKDFSISKPEDAELLQGIHLVEPPNKTIVEENNDVYIKDILDDEYSDVDEIKSFFAEG